MNMERRKGEVLRSNSPAVRRSPPEKGGSPNIQDEFLNRLRKERTPVAVLLTTGVKLSGRIKSFDKYSLMLESEQQEQLLFKHAIATVSRTEG